MKTYKLAAATLLLLVFLAISFSSCLDSNQSTANSSTQSKASSTLILQISFRQDQIARPVSGRLAQMQAEGMNIANLSIQRIYIYLQQPLTPAQTGELQALGITVYLDSWIPPAGNNLNGFCLADLPVDKLPALAAKDYVVSFDTAEKTLRPQSGLKQGA